jgi:hypothetical protein
MLLFLSHGQGFLTSGATSSKRTEFEADRIFSAKLTMCEACLQEAGWLTTGRSRTPEQTRPNYARQWEEIAIR